MKLGKKNNVFLVLDTRGGICGCFKKRVDAEKYISSSQNCFIKKIKVETYETN